LPTAAGRAACAGWVHLSTDGIRTTDQATLALDDLPVPTAEAEVLVTTKRPSLMPADVSGTAGAMGWRVQTWPRGMLRTHQLQLFLTPRRDVGVVKAITLIAGDVEARALTSGMRPTKAAIVDDITARRLAAAKDLVVQFDGGKRYTLRPNPLQAALAAHDAAATAMPAPPSDQPPLSSPSDADVATVLVPVFDDGRR
jgi:hypothetical protein